jgi:uncharacterized NAD(P)/FAD-binding protein YdhS
VQRPHTIIILGAGFSGTAVAINLLRRADCAPLRVVLVERGAFARGTAYAERDYPYLLNVAAARMSANSADPLEFLRFAQQQVPNARADSFLPRTLYGEYLEWSLERAEADALPHLSLDRIRASACAVAPASSGAAYRVRLSDGRELAGDEVVLALGTAPPKPLLAARELQGSPHYVADPWRAPIALRPGESVLVVGTGLTMADVVTAGAGTAGVRFAALSRHGLLPARQTVHVRDPGYGRASLDHLRQAAAASAGALLRTVRTLADDLGRRGMDWRAAITLVREHAPELWHSMPAPERRRFLRHLRTYWDVHRHRLPEQTLEQLAALRHQHRLTVHAGRVLDLQLRDGRVRVSWRPRGSQLRATMDVDRVINCSGPDQDPRAARDPLLRSLLARGLAVADPLGLGVRTGKYGALIDAHGRASRGLYYLGAMLQAGHWESTAVPELRSRAERLAQHLTTSVFRQAVAS